MTKNSNKIEHIFKKIQIDNIKLSYFEITEHLGKIWVASNGKIECENYPNYSLYEEYFLWNILCFCRKKDCQMEIPDRLTLSGFRLPYLFK